MAVRTGPVRVFGRIEPRIAAPEGHIAGRRGISEYYRGAAKNQGHAVLSARWAQVGGGRVHSATLATT